MNHRALVFCPDRNTDSRQASGSTGARNSILNQSSRGNRRSGRAAGVANRFRIGADIALTCRTRAVEKWRQLSYGACADKIPNEAAGGCSFPSPAHRVDNGEISDRSTAVEPNPERNVYLADFSRTDP